MKFFPVARPHVAACFAAAITGLAGAQPADYPHATLQPGQVDPKPAPHPRAVCSCIDGTLENESNCGVPTDILNGGCNYAPVLFSSINIGQAICGTFGTMLVDGTNTRDTDWYRFTTATDGEINALVRAESLAEVFIFRGDVCGQMINVGHGFAQACTDYVLTTAFEPAGVYVVVVAPAVFSGIVCGSPETAYRVLVTTGPVNNSCAAAVPVVAGGTYSGTLDLASNDGASSCGSTSTSPDVWYSFTAPNACGTLVVNTCGTNDAPGVDAGIDTVLSAFNGCGGTELACNDDSIDGACEGLDASLRRDSAIRIGVMPLQQVLIRVANFNAGETGPFTLHVGFESTLPNDACASAIQLYPGMTPFCNAAATTDGPVHSACINVNSDIWYFCERLGDGRVTIDTCNGNSFDTTLAVYRSLTCGTIGGATLLGCNDDAFCGLNGRGSRVSFRAQPNYRYFVRVGGYQANTGTGNIAMSLDACTCDFNADGVLNSQDFFDFLNCFFGGSCPVGVSADYNADSVVNSQDFFDFLACFFSPPGAC